MAKRYRSDALAAVRETALGTNGHPSRRPLLTERHAGNPRADAP
jgi:hypothetical protein